jgi:glycosyltransferase involved in cell wall biosynthesis
MVALSRWLRRHRTQIDLVCVSRLRFDACAAIRALRHTNIPIVLRAEDAGSYGDCQWQKTSRFGGRFRRWCQAADAVIAPDAGVERELLEANYAPSRICRIANGVATAIVANGGKRFDARQALADVNGNLTAAVDAPVALHIGRLRKGRGLLDLIEAWRAVVYRWPTARLWLVGDGPFRDTLYRRIVDLDLQHCVSMPGTFDEVDELFTAASLFVCPGDEPGLPQALLEAVAAGAPVIAAETPDLRQHQGIGGVHAELVPPRNVNALSDAMIRVIDQPPSRETLTAACKRILQQHSITHMVKEHWQLFERLIGSKSSGA